MPWTGELVDLGTINEWSGPPHRTPVRRSVFGAAPRRRQRQQFSHGFRDDSRVARYRATGFSVGPFAAVQWEHKDDDAEIARRVLNLLADRRMLWKDFSLEIEEHCVRSADETRKGLGLHLDNPEIGPDLIRRLQLLQRLFRDFIDEVGSGGGDWGRPWRSVGTDPLSVALGKLRGLVGVQVGEMAAEFGLEVSDELAAIIPVQKGWPFERVAE